MIYTIVSELEGELTKEVEYTKFLRSQRMLDTFIKELNFFSKNQQKLLDRSLKKTMLVKKEKVIFQNLTDDPD